MFKVGDVVTTRHPVKVKLPGVRGRKFFYVTPGGKWEVLAVESNGPRQPIYRLKCDRFEIERKEFRLKRLK